MSGGPDPCLDLIQQIIERGRADGTITRDVTPHDIVVFGAMTDYQHIHARAAGTS